MRREEGDERLLRAPRAEDRLDGELGMELRRRADRRQHGVALGGREKLLERGAIVLRVPGHGEVVHAAEFNAREAEPIDHRGRAATGGGDDRNLRSPRERQWFLSGEQRRDLDQRFEHVDAHDAAVAEVRVERRVRAGERTGVRARELDAERGAAELVRDERLARRMRHARRARQALGIAHRLQK